MEGVVPEVVNNSVAVVYAAADPDYAADASLGLEGFHVSFQSNFGQSEDIAEVLGVVGL